ncbi:MAG: NYN domain-containing protein [Phycisphaerae bacterium]|nr:NYN domain-containing protein [Phycisphaerae bacterium]
MPVLVDGYNLMHAAQASPHGSELTGRGLLCRLLGDWSQRRGEAVTIVFDGAAPAPGLAEQLGDSRITVRYSADRTADALIAEQIAASSAPRRLLVVSSDREVQRAARRRGAAIAESPAFVAQMMRELADDRPAGADREPSDKRRGVEGARRDEWIERFGFDPQGEEPFEHP